MAPKGKKSKNSRPPSRIPPQSAPPDFSRKKGASVPGNKQDFLSASITSVLRSPILQLGIISLLFWIVYLNISTSRLDMNGDNFYYYIFGKSLAQGTGYANFLSSVPVPENHYPPGYPLIISVFLKLGVSNIAFFNYLNGFFAWGTIIFLYLWGRGIGLKKTIIFISSILIALNPAFLNYARINMSELPFIFFVSLGFWALSNLKPTQIRSVKILFLLLLSFSIISSYYIRTSGIAFLLAVLATFIYRKEWKKACVVFISFSAAVIPWVIRSDRLGGNDYIAQMQLKNPYNRDMGKAGISDYISRIFDNLSIYISKVIPNDFLNYHDLYSGQTTPSWLIGCIVSAFIITGFVKTWKKAPYLTLYVIFSVAILLIWPTVWTGIRFLIAIVPFMIILTVAGLDFIFGKLAAKAGFKWQPAILLILLLFTLGPVKALSEDVEDNTPPGYLAFFAAGDWLSTHSPANVIVCSRKPELLYVKSGKLGVSYLSTKDEKALIQDLIHKKVDYVILDQLGFGSTPRYLYPAIIHHPQYFKLVYQVKNPDTYVFKFIRN